MALMKCIECGHEVSDKAQVCMNCGCPVSEIKKELEERKVLTNSNLKAMEAFIDEAGVLHIPEYVERIENMLLWGNLRMAKDYHAIYIPASVKTISKLAFRRVWKDLEIYIESATNDYCVPIKFQRFSPVFVNYKNDALQNQLCQIGIKYKLYDYEKQEIIPFAEREKNEAEVEGKYFAPYLSEAEKKKYSEALIMGETISIPKTVKMLLAGDFDWKEIERRSEEQIKEELFFPAYHTIWLENNISYISEDFLQSAEPIYIAYQGDEDLERYYYAKDVVHFRCKEEGDVGKRLVDLNANVQFRNAEGFDTRKISSIDDRRQRVLFPYYDSICWTCHNTGLLAEKAWAKSDKEEAFNGKISLRIPDEYTMIEERALEAGVYEFPWEEIYFGKKMDLSCLQFDKMAKTITKFFIPYMCDIEEDAFVNVKRDVVIYCEEGSCAERAALYAGKKIVYYDFKSQHEYKKGEGTLKIMKSSVKDLYIIIDENSETALDILNALFKNYDVLILECNTINFEMEYVVKNALNQGGIEYISVPYYSE